MTLILILLTTFAHAAPNSCREIFLSHVGETHYSVHISKLRPTQMQVGRALVEIRAVELMQEAAAANLSPRDFVLKTRAQKPVPAVISPRGEFFITDSHHGISIIYRMLGKVADVKLTLNIVRDYRQPKFDGEAWSYEEFIYNLQAPIADGGLAKGQFAKELKGKVPDARFAYLPVRFDKLQDNPMRSLVGAAFKLRGVLPTDFKDYIEFDVADLIPPNTFENLEFSSARVEQVADYIFSNSVILEYLSINRNAAGSLQ